MNAVTTARAESVFHAKRFYRELDELLGERGTMSLTDEWYRWLAGRLLERYGPELSIRNARLYEEDDRGFVLRHEVGAQHEGDGELVLSRTYPPVKFLEEHGVFIFDETVTGQSPELERRIHPDGRESAALLIRGEPQRILAFGLGEGWVRDDLDFCLNTLRNAINLRNRVQSLTDDMEQAAEIQHSLLPEATPVYPGFTIAARSEPADLVGGDFYDFLRLDDGILGLHMGDASGHGLGAALVSRDVVTGLRIVTEGALKVTEVVRRLNRVIGRAQLSSRFVSLVYLELEPDGNVSYVNAGHPAPWILGERDTRRLHVGGTVLGPLPDARFQRGFARIAPGETLVVVTDGFLDLQDARGRPFEDAGVEETVRPLVGRPAEEILSALFAAARAHSGSRSWPDDTSAIVVTRDRTKTG